VVGFRIESWAAFVPGVEHLYKHPQVITEPLNKSSLKLIPPMLRRRFSTLGKYAISAALHVLPEGESIPTIFSSRYGETGLTLSLLDGIGQDEAMSPTNFSLAVHNAVSGLFSIARKDYSAVTSIAAMKGLVLQTLLEAAAQLDTVDKVLCVIYDVPIPDIDRQYAPNDAIPYAIAVILSQGKECIIDQDSLNIAGSKPSHDFLETEPFRFINLLMGVTNEMESELNGTIWRIKMTES